MQVSAELRWFWKDSLPSAVDSWFHLAPFPPGGGKPRVDEYLLDPSQTELGVKKRGGGQGVEVKGLVALGRDVSAPFTGRVQIWSKWISQPLALDSLPRLTLTKTRWLRKFDTSAGSVVEIALGTNEMPIDPLAARPDRGCQVELVVIEPAAGGVWHSIGFEAFGDLTTVESSLDRVLSSLTAGAPPLANAIHLSYPEWIAGTLNEPSRMS